MKTTWFFLRLALMLIIGLNESCVNDDEYDVPSVIIEPANIDLNNVITINSLSNEFEQALLAEADDLGISTTDELAINELRQSFKLSFEDNLRYIEGFVISNDLAGNFFEELIIQDKPNEPTRGVKILIDSNPLYVTYQFGRKVYVKIEGLTVGYDSGVFSLGISGGNKLEKIGESQRYSYLIRDSIVAAIIPLPLNISEFTAAKTNLYIRLNNVQFNRYEALGDNRKTFAAEPNDEFDGERTLEDCVDGISTVFSTSTFADFKAMLLPEGRGMLDGILTLNFFGDTYNIVINDPTNILFDNMERCDPTEINCGLISLTGINVLFNDFFENQIIGQPISGNGWTNYIEEGTETWEAFYSETSNVSLGISARMSSYNSGTNSSIGWLITPEIDFNMQNGESLKFKTSNSFADGSRLELLFSNDWDGLIENVVNARWDVLSSAYIVQDNDNFASWFSSGNVDLDCIQGTGYIAWKYVGRSNPDFDGTYELDEIEIESN